MVAAIPVQMALRDAFLAAGLGCLLCLIYSGLRFVLGQSAVALAFSDVFCCISVVLMLRSAAVSCFYSGLPRWYDLLACVSAFLLCRSALGPFLEKMRAMFWRALTFPLQWIGRYVFAPFWRRLFRCAKARGKKRHVKKLEKMKRVNKKRLQNTGRVLYNSK